MQVSLYPTTRRMSQIEFEHTMNQQAEENNVDPDGANDTLCAACTLPIFSTPLGSDDGHFSLHRDCASLPEELTGHVLHQEPLCLIKKLPDAREDIICRNCEGKCEGFFYQCPEDACGFALDILCAVPIGRIKVVHRSHPHELVPVRGATSVACGACGLEHEGGELSYFCNLCRFWIHQDCAVLPNLIRHKQHDITDRRRRQHLFCLAYDVRPSDERMWTARTCSLCCEELSPSCLGWYFCTSCFPVITSHITCATSDPDSFHRVLTREAVGSMIHSPMDDDQKSMVCYLLDNASSSSATEGKGELLEGIHDHPLVFYDQFDSHHDNKRPSSSNLCNGCVQPIEPPFHGCNVCSDFFLHSFCANLPSQHPCLTSTCCSDDSVDGQSSPLTLFPVSDNFFSSKFTCNCCEGQCNGLAYGCRKCNLKADVQCSFLPPAITHKAHSQTHLLFLHVNDTDMCQCCGLWFDIEVCYECSSCYDFRLHVRCALLPLSVAHEYDRHPLKLITQPKDGEHFCDVCERDLDTENWFYGCRVCDQSFHVSCIPSVGEYSRIKFGGTLRVGCHGCPLTSVRLLDSYSHTCGACNRTIEGKKDGIAFECSKCYFWMHEDCAEKERIEIELEICALE